MPSSSGDTSFLDMNEIPHFSITWRCAAFHVPFVSSTHSPERRATARGAQENGAGAGSWKLQVTPSSAGPAPHPPPTPGTTADQHDVPDWPSAQPLASSYSVSPPPSHLERINRSALLQDIKAQRWGRLKPLEEARTQVGLYPQKELPDAV